MSNNLYETHVYSYQISTETHDYWRATMHHENKQSISQFFFSNKYSSFDPPIYKVHRTQWIYIYIIRCRGIDINGKTN